MSETKLIAETCGNCGVDVRENTLFCYACGTRVAESAPEPVTEPEGDLEALTNGASAAKDVEMHAALDDLAVRFKIDEPDESDNELAKAAAERRKARFKQRKRTEYVWEPTEESASRLIVLVAVIVTILAAVTVYFIVLWK